MIDSSDHTITLDNGHILQKSDLAIKGKLFPSPKKNRGEPTIHRAQVTCTFEFSQKEEAISAKEDDIDRHPSAKAGHPRAGRPTQTSYSPTDAEITQDLIHISSVSSSSLNLNSSDGIIDDYFDDMTNNNLPPSHQAESNQGLSVTGNAHSPQSRPNLSVNTDQRSIIEVPDSAEIEGSENNLILLDSAPEGLAPSVFQPRHSRRRRNLGLPKFIGERQNIDIVFEKDDRLHLQCTMILLINQGLHSLFPNLRTR